MTMTQLSSVGFADQTALVKYSSRMYSPDRTTANPFSCNRNSWAEANSLDDGMLFLGLNTSMWLPSSNFNECNGNSIYFTGVDMFLGNDSGVYNLEDRSYGSMYDEAMKPLYPKPVWVVPYPLKKKKVGFLA